MKGNKNLYRLIPKVDDLLENEDINKLLDLMPRKLVVDSIREEIDLIREDIKNKILDENNMQERIKLLPELITIRANRKNSCKLRRVINGTGVVIHTNIGRSLIHKDVMDNVVEIATNYSNLEYDLEVEVLDIVI